MTQKLNALKIDIHTHILPSILPDMSAISDSKEWINLIGSQKIHTGGDDDFMDLDGTSEPAKMMKGDVFFREISCNCWSPKERIKECDDTGVHVQVLSTVPVMYNYDKNPNEALFLHKYLNDHICRVVKTYPKRFVGLGCIPLQDVPLAIEEMDRCLKMGMKGVAIGSHVNDWNLDHPELDSFWKAAEENNCSIFIHPWDMEMNGRMKNYWFPWLIGMPSETTVAVCSIIMGGVLERYPSLKICFAHGGGSFPGTIGRIEHGFNVRPDLCASRTQIGAII